MLCKYFDQDKILIPSEDLDKDKFLMLCVDFNQDKVLILSENLDQEKKLVHKAVKGEQYDSAVNNMECDIETKNLESVSVILAPEDNSNTLSDAENKWERI